jgi:hypothetical protein
MLNVREKALNERKTHKPSYQIEKSRLFELFVKGLEEGTNHCQSNTWLNNIESLSTELAGKDVETEFLESDQDGVLGDVFDSIFKSNDISLDDQMEDEDDNEDDDCSDNEEDALDVNIVKSDCKTIALSDIFSAGEVKLEQKRPRKTRED